jgi:6-phosphogluconate dehydrogenase
LLQLGIIGLGKMGSNLALQALAKGIRVTGYSKRIRDEPKLRGAGLLLAKDLIALTQELRSPRLILLFVPAGSAVDETLEALVPHLEPGDVVADAGNSHFRDSVRRQRRLAEQGIGFVDCGSSGGPAGALQGACFMVGGQDDAVHVAEPVLKALSVPGGFIHAGPPGAGHFVKLIHNAIEFGMLQAIGEGVALLRASDYELDLPGLFENWSHGSVIRGWLVELMAQGLRENPDLARISSHVEDTGEVNWVVEEALRRELPVPVIMHSVIELFSSRDRDKAASKAVAILRHGFGGHPFGEAPELAEERKKGRADPKRR